MPEYGWGHGFERLQRPPGHLEHPDLQGDRQTMAVTIARENRRPFLGRIGEEVADFEVGQLWGDRLEPQERDTPVLHTMLLTRSHAPGPSTARGREVRPWRG